MKEIAWLRPSNEEKKVETPGFVENYNFDFANSSVEETIDYFSNDKNWLKGVLVSEITYKMRTNLESFLNEDILNKISFIFSKQNKNKYAADRLLDSFSYFLMSLNCNRGKAEKTVFDKLINTLKNISTDEESNFFLTMRLEKAVDEDERFGFNANEIKTFEPFLLTEKRYAFNVGNDIIIAPENKFNEISGISNELVSATKRLNGFYSSVGHFVAENSMKNPFVEHHNKIKRKSEKLIEKNFDNCSSLKDVILQSELEFTDDFQNKQKVEEKYHDYLFMMKKDNIDKLNKDFGINLQKMSVLEQVYFLDFIKDITLGEANRTKNFFNEYGENAAKSFLALSIDSDLSHKLIAIGEKMNPNQAKKVFSKIAEINDLAVQSEKELSSLVFKNPKELDFKSVRLELIKKASSLVSSFSYNLYDENFSDDKIQKLLSDLEDTKSEIILLTSVLREVDEFNIEDFNNFELSIKDYGVDLNSQDKQEILSLASNNWNDFDNKKMTEVVINSLKEALERSADQKSYILKYEGEIVAYIRFEPMNDGSLYAGSFNVSKNLRGFKIGTELMKKSLIAEGESSILKAAASIKMSTSCFYVEKVGFIADGLVGSYYNTGEKMFSIKLDNEFNKGVKTKKLSEAELRAEVRDYKKLNEILGDSVIILKFDLASEMEDYENALDLLLAKTDDKLNKEEENGYLLTRYFQDRSVAGDVRYLVFEKD